VWPVPDFLDFGQCAPQRVVTYADFLGLSEIIVHPCIACLVGHLCCLCYLPSASTGRVSARDVVRSAWLSSTAFRGKNRAYPFREAQLWMLQVQVFLGIVHKQMLRQLRFGRRLSFRDIRELGCLSVVNRGSRCTATHPINQ
jgi:hypothetical protein